MANTFRLEFRRGYPLLLHVAIGLFILPPGLSQWCNTNDDEPLINISSTPPSNKLPIHASINLTCTAWQTVDKATIKPKTRPHRIEWFDPQGRLIGDECKAQSPAAARMKCTRMVRNLTEEKFGNYTCKASNGYNDCSNKRFSIILQDVKEQSTEGKKPTVISTEEDIVRIRKMKPKLECSKLRLEIKI